MSRDFSMPLDHQAPRGYTLRRAMLRPDRYLAALLAEIPDAELAIATGALPGRVGRLRLAGWPTTTRWAADVQALADLVDAVPLDLERLLLQVGVRP
jgi:hypothetical protein